MSGNITTFSYYTKTTETIDQRFSVLLEFFDKKDLLNLKPLQDSIHRDYLIKQHLFLDFDNPEHPLIDVFSSDEDSNDEYINTHSPTVKDVISNIWDEKAIIKATNLNEIPKRARPALMFSRLDQWMTSYDLKQFILDIPLFKKDNFSPDIEETLMLNREDQARGFVVFYNLDHANRVYCYFNNVVKKKSVPSKNSKGELIEVDWAFDKTDLKDSKWYAVILRNVPPLCNVDVIRNQCSLRGEKVLYVVSPVLIKSQYCSIVVMDDINDCEKICFALNNKEISRNKILKVNIHPKSCKLRENLQENSNFSSYFKRSVVKLTDHALLSEKCDLTLKEMREKNNEKYYKNNLNLQQKIDRKYNNKDPLISIINNKEYEDIFSKMKESIILINKNNSASSNPINPQKISEIHFEDNHKNNDISSSVNLQPIINNSFMNINNITQFPPVPIINQINYNNMQYIKANQINIMNTVRPKVPVYPMPVYPTQLHTNKLQQPILTNPQIMPGIAPCFLNHFINPNPNIIIPAPTNVNPVIMNNQVRFGTFSPMPPPVFFPQHFIVTNPFPTNPYIINGTVNLQQTVPQNIPSQTIINNHISVTEKPKLPITQAKIEIVEDEKKKEKSLGKEPKIEEGKSHCTKEAITIIKLPKIENLPPLPKEEKEVQKIETNSDYLLSNKSVVENLSKNSKMNNVSKNKTINIVLNKAKDNNSSIIDVKKIPVSTNSITSSSSSNDSSESDDDESESSSDSSSESKVTKKKRWRKASKSRSKSKSGSYKGKREYKLGKYDKRRNKRETKKRSRNK